MQQRQRQRRRHHHQPLPFILPIWLARKVDQLIVNYRYRHYEHYSSLLPGETSESTTSATVITTYFFAAARLLWSISRELAMLGGGSGSRSRVDGLYDSIATSPTSTAPTALEQHRNDISHDIEMVSSSHHSSTNIHDVDVEGGHLIHTPPTKTLAVIAMIQAMLVPTTNLAIPTNDNIKETTTIYITMMMVDVVNFICMVLCVYHYRLQLYTFSFYLLCMLHMLDRMPFVMATVSSINSNNC